MTTIKLRRGTSSSFSTNNPTLAAGEPAFETDTGKLKIGDGTTAYNSLAYVGDGFGLKNNATGTDSLAILGTTNRNNSVVIGSGASASGPNSVIIGTGATTSGSTGQYILIGANSSSNATNTVTIGYDISNNGQNTVLIGISAYNSGSSSSVAIGNTAKCVSANQSVALGYKAESRALGAIQLGEGSNTSSNTLKFRTYQLLSSSGYIPNDRLNLDTTVTSASGNPVTSGAVYTAIDNAVNGVTSSLNNLNSGTGTV